MSNQLPARFWSKVNKDGPIHPYNQELGKCWVWMASCNFGYGLFGVNDKTVRAHRLTLEDKLGRPISPGMDSMHSCDNRPCVNPDHLSEGTRQDNSDDKVNKGRQSKGEQMVNAKRTEGLRSNNTSGYKGVSWNKQHSKWEVKIMVNYKCIFLGLHDTLEAAIAARKAGEEKYWRKHS